MNKAQKAAEFAKIPRCIAPRPEDIKPDLATAFERWKSLGEYPPDAVLCEFVGCEIPGQIGDKAKPYKEVATGERVSAEKWEFLTEVQFTIGKNNRKFFVIFKKCD